MDATRGSESRRNERQSLPARWSREEEKEDKGKNKRCVRGRGSEKKRSKKKKARN